ncbi:MAG TPA: trypsin-like peptidase domain-containing protein [Candidatus Limnocylindria bacterium]|nr:trypsin-like peptidase domain-containing protein [Candidatus Limnocylindria bacterium]
MRHRGFALAAGLVLGALAVAIFGRGGGPGRTSSSGVDTAIAAPDLSASRRTAIVTAAQRVSPSVVSVSVVTTRVVRADPFFDRFFPQSEYRERIPGLGSGVIVDASGMVLTNEHVIRDADEIRITLTDGRQLEAQVLGATPIYDLAVLKVTAPRLPPATLGNSDDLVVGEWAIAIGNPFGYLLNDTQPSVSAGVVSATRRDIKSEATSTGVFKNMIQTDAAINPGNSGGPLVNADGQVIGINTFIFTASGGSIGLGFAIPINLAKQVLEEVRTYGRVRAAWPGMTVQPLTPYLARRLGYQDLGGLVVSRVDPGGPAAKAGVRAGDRIRSVNGQTINSVDDAQRSIYGSGVGDRLTLGIERGNQRHTLTLTLAEAPRRGS